MRRKPWGVVGGHHAVEFPVRGAAVDAGAEPGRGKHGRFQAVGGHARQSASAWSNCSRKRAFRPASSTWCTASGEAGEALVRHPGVNVVLFTGSYDVGIAFRSLRRSYDRIVACEMGSKSAVIVCDDAKLDLAVNGGIISALQDQRPALRFRGAGARAPKSSSTLRREVRGHGETLEFGDPLDANNFTGPLINQAAVEKVASTTTWRTRKAPTILLDGGR